MELWRLCILVGTAGLTSGCIFGAVGDSCEIDTSDLVIDARVVDDDGLVRGSAEFRSGFIRVELCDEDVLSVNGVQATELTKSLGHEYGVSWDPEEDIEEFTFTLQRSDDEVEVGQIRLPPRFAITAPGAGESYPRSAALSVTWDPPRDGEEINLRIEDELAGPCSVADGAPDYAEGVDVADTGSYEVAAGSFDYSDVLGTDGTCEAFVDLRRIATTEVAEAFDPDSELTARVRRQVDFILVP